jgi:hypothetical protein
VGVQRRAIEKVERERRRMIYLTFWKELVCICVSRRDQEAKRRTKKRKEKIIGK